jgi:hypothetical protein
MRRIILIAAVSAAMAAPSFAQMTTAPPTTAGSPQTIDDIRSEYYVRAGPFYVKPELFLKELGVDSNVFNQAGDEKSDFTFTVTPQAGVAVPIARRALFRTSLGFDAVYFAHYGSERSIDPQVSARGEFYANRLTFFADGSYLNTRQRPNYEIDLRSRHLETTGSAGVNIGLTYKLSLELAGLAGTTRFNGDAYFLGQSLKETLDRDSVGYAVTLRERLTPLTTIAVRYDDRNDTFPSSPVRNNDSYRILPGLEFKPRALISGSAYVGYRKVRSLSGALPEYRGLASQVALSYTLLGSTVFAITAYRDISYSFEVNTPYYLDNSVGGFMRRELGGRFDVVVNAARHRYDYRELLTLSAPDGKARADTTDTYGASVGYRVKRQARVGFGFSYWTRGSTVLSYPGANGLRIGTTVDYGF